MRADVGALVALDAVLLDPLGNVDRDAALLVARGGEGEDAVRRERGDRQLVPLLAQDREDHVAHVVGHLLVQPEIGAALVVGVAPGVGIPDLNEALHRQIHRGQVHLHHLLTLPAVLLADRVLQKFHGPLEGKHPGELEEGGLHDHVDAPAKPCRLRDADRIDVVETDLLRRDGPAHRRRQVLFHRLGRVPR